MPAAPRQHWNFQRTQKLLPEARQAVALEYIAYYLDRVEQHLAKITTSLTTDPPDGFSVLSALKDVGDAAKEIAERDR